MFLGSQTANKSTTSQRVTQDEKEINKTHKADLESQTEIKQWSTH